MLHFRKRASAGLFKRLRGDERGAVAVQFAFLALPISILAFGLLDMNRLSVQRRQLQDALDAATLMAARSTATTNSGLDTVGDAAFAAEMAGLGLTLTTANTTFVSGTGNKVIGSASVTVTPIISNLWTNGNSTVTASSEVLRSVNKLEVALVLDNTGSMDYDLGSGGKKIDALIDASKDLVDTLYAAAARASETDAVKIAVVPFSMTVNVGSTYSSANWITGTMPDQAYYGPDVFATSQNRFTMMTQTGTTWAGCVESRPHPYDITDDAPSPSTPASMFIPFFAPDEPDDNTVKYPSSSSKYRDSRVRNNGEIYNNWITDDKTSSTDWFTRQGEVAKYATGNKSKVISQAKTGTDYGPNDGCGIASVLRMTNVRTSAGATTVKDKLDDMVATGNTNVAMGMVWGWHMVSPNAPFADGSAYGTKNVSKVIVLLTDGDNVMSETGNPNDSTYSGYGYVWQKRLKNASNVSLDTGASGADRRDAMDSRQTKTCAAAKAKGVIIYSIGVGVSDHSKVVLQGCASTSDKYYDVTNADQLTAVFDAIAGSIQNLRISK
ncbi:pilus assembly protein TadG-related protein [Caulobacter sp. ErkDOM-E]|uniref:pilus assembly protein TadG-related protein n=1 Tax=Caulobacter sp. ErkDOM-E TaxID=3402778 RepID=UPI003AF48C38